MKLPASRQSRLNLLGAAIVVVGLLSATCLWIAQERIDRQSAVPPSDAIDQLPVLDSRKQVRELERYYGQSGVLMEELVEWLKSLGHGKRLAATIAVASSVVGAGCFLAAAYLVPALERARQRLN